MEVTVDHATLLERESILHIDVSVHFAPKVDIHAYDIALDYGCLTNNYTSLGSNLSFEGTVDTDVPTSRPHPTEVSL